MQQPPPPPARRFGVVPIVATVLAVVLVIAGGVVLWRTLAAAAVLARPRCCRPRPSRWSAVDLDPSAGQKVEAIKTLRKLPSWNERTGVRPDSDLVKVLFERAQKEGFCPKLDYDQDVKPWVGQRAGVGGVLRRRRARARVRAAGQGHRQGEGRLRGRGEVRRRRHGHRLDRHRRLPRGQRLDEATPRRSQRRGDDPARRRRGVPEVDRRGGRRRHRQRLRRSVRGHGARETRSPGSADSCRVWASASRASCPATSPRTCRPS